LRGRAGRRGPAPSARERGGRALHRRRDPPGAVPRGSPAPRRRRSRGRGGALRGWPPAHHAAEGRPMSSPAPADTPALPLPDALPVLPLKGVVVFPLAISPLAVGQPRSVQLVDDAMRGNRLLALVAQRSESVEQPVAGDLYRV